MRALSI